MTIVFNTDAYNIRTNSRGQSRMRHFNYGTDFQALNAANKEKTEKLK